MERRLTAFLLVNLALTAVVVGTLAVALARREPVAALEQARDEARAGLEAVRDAVAGDLAAVEQELARRLAGTSTDTDSLRALERATPLARAAFLLDPHGSLLHPLPGTATAPERAFLQRAAAILAGKAVLPTTHHDETSAGVTAKHGDSLVALAADRPHGWVTWYWDDGVQVLFWARAAGGGVVGVEVERVALLARLVGRMPAAPGEAHLALVDATARPVYVWGAPQAAQGAKPLATVHLPSPLQAWSLTHTPSVQQGASRAMARELSMLRVLAPAGMAALLLMGLGVWLWRESRRAMREAAQRVSFVTQVSHELKTPLTNIRLYAELLAEELTDDDTAAGKAQVIVAESQRLSRLINNILTFSRRQRGQLALHRGPVLVDDVVEATVGPFRPSLDQKGILVEVTRGAPAPVAADADALGQILANLVSNVEKYAAPGRLLRVESSQDGQWTRVTVSDRGSGIAPPHRDRVFQPFYRVSDRITDGVTGTGIGLTIARDLARMHGGDLVLDDTGGAGASFTLTLPRQPEAAP
jgi:signal transduction histidine kinase